MSNKIKRHKVAAVASVEREERGADYFWNNSSIIVADAERASY